MNYSADFLSLFCFALAEIKSCTFYLQLEPSILRLTFKLSCRSLGAQVLIDDNPQFALECAEAGTKVLLFDYDNSYPWCKSGTAASHPQVTIVQNWREVKQHLLSWTKCPENNKYA